MNRFRLRSWLILRIIVLSYLVSFQGNGRFPGWTRTTLRDGKIRWDNPGQSEKREKKKILRKKRLSKESRQFREKEGSPVF